MKTEKESTDEDLRDVLLAFWMDAMGNEENQWPERIKVSELLAKYILESGRTPVKRRGVSRPPTAEILRLAEKMELIPEHLKEVKDEDE